MPTAAQAPAADTLRLAKACNEFAADLCAKLAAQGSSTCSPASISIALLMLLPGAKGNTATELASVLRLPEELRGDALHTAAADLLKQSGFVASAGRSGGEKPATQHLANDIWVQKGFPLVDSYVDLLRGSFAADQRVVDFAKDPEAVRKTINAHIAKATNDRIRDLIPEGLVGEATRLVLTNALWFKAGWVHPFPEGSTADAPFQLANGTRVDAPMMHVEDQFQYAESEQWQFVALPFESGYIRLEAMLPRGKTTLAQAESMLLTGAHAATLTVERVRVSLPRFRVAASHRLREPLRALGMLDAFAAGVADFSAMDPKKLLVVDDIVHKTWIAVDEKGAEAAAATATVLKVGSAAPRGEPKVFVADRPFVFVLRDARTGFVLFVGRVDDPRESKQAGG
ncbi:MAG: serpin family protein [Planctomycetota bacterium]